MKAFILFLYIFCGIIAISAIVISCLVLLQIKYKENFKSKKLSFLLSYYNQKDILKKHLSFWKKYSQKYKDDISFIIVDDCSKEPAINILKEEEGIDGLDIHLYRIKKDLPYNIAGARNLAFKEMRTEWGLLLDMDTLVDNDMIKEIFNILKKEEGTPNSHHAYKFNRKVPNQPNHGENGKIHPAITLIRQKDYWLIGGCDEDLAGHYGFTDPTFWYRAKDKIKVIVKKNIYITYDPDGQTDMKRDNSHNAKIFEKKKKDNSWSKDYLRFPWKKVKL